MLLTLSDDPAVTIKALSPSDAGSVAAVTQLRSVPVPTEGAAKLRPPKINTNDASVVISVRVGQEELLLLGADLEERASPNLGWQAVVGDWSLSDGKHKVFKVPHHGSSNGHLNEVWEKMLCATQRVSLRVLCMAIQSCRNVRTASASLHSQDTHS